MKRKDFESLMRGLEQARDFLTGKTEGCVVHRVKAIEDWGGAREGKSKI